MPNIRLCDRKLMCENSRFKIYFDHLAGTGGSFVKDYLVVWPRFRTEHGVTGVSVLPVFRGKLGLIKVYRHPVGRYLWELPRGFVDNGETEEISALRELKEETGLECSLPDIRELGSYMPEPGILSGTIKIFLALNCVSVGTFQVSELGHKEFRTFSLEEYRMLIESSEIMDPSTLIAYHKFVESISGERVV